MTTITVRTAAEWREWLAQNSATENEVWLVIQHKNSDIPSPRYHEAVEQALCFGWIDGLHRKHDATSSRLRFTPRRKRSSWSPLNRERAEKLIGLGLMTERGQAMIDAAKANGMWPLTP
ncbi:YdeI/OmpD-associated family protein [Phytoactinopolyspora halotolerans]|uniref:Bacteriocin-protection protein n=1 Tax=Phytoactinopolyspora halotolerans TaxID=1981512 RepID=A0A6L9S4U3_9ACTN|nr:hypothetical protein [Phytoactinopolyspora halotolerans]NED99643.1 hypothetical protein [Phytoactinopolyspora halotolerans]